MDGVMRRCKCGILVEVGVKRCYRCRRINITAGDWVSSALLGVCIGLVVVAVGSIWISG